jgi:catechol 2,3-dioxygenase-like lactoylglutathione lyase family enzyme
MTQTLAQVTLVVREYDEAIAFFTKKLGFHLLEDSALGDGKRWVVVQPPGPASVRLLLARASSPQEIAAIGNQTGGRVFLFLHTDNFWSDYRAMQSRGVPFLEDPREESYGTVAVFEDLYRNKWDLLMPSARNADKDAESASDSSL